VFFILILAVTLAAIWFAGDVTGSRTAVVAAGALAGIGISILVAFWWSGQFEQRVQKLVTVIEAGSPALGEELARETSDKLFSEVIRTWQGAVRSLQQGWVDKQDEARRNYQALAELIRMMAKAVDERAPYLRGHSERVSQYSAAIAEKLGLNEKEVEQIRLAALLHDIGTLGIEDYLVTKDAPLAPDEFEIIKAHTVKGAAILRPIELLRDMVPGVELHHESLDGMGYPYGLKGDDIPLMARIVAVADSFDAMTTPRPYQAAMNSEYVLEIMKRLAGTRYDPSVVNALTVLVRSGAVEVRQMRIPVSFRMRRPLVETA
jgi:putative nucleotidyltransferase with HDIG domain